MMTPRHIRRAGIAAAVLAVIALVAWLWTSQGPMAPVKITVAKVEKGPLVARTFGIGTIEARRSYALGATTASRVLRVLVDQGDAVKAGQLLAEFDPVDLEDRLAGAGMGAERAASAVRVAQAQLAEARSRSALALAGARRATELRDKGFISQEAVETKVHEASASKAAQEAAEAQLRVTERERDRALADLSGTRNLRAQARLLSPIDGVVSARLAEPGTTVSAGQAVLQLIDPASLWVKARIDQGQSSGVQAGQPAEIVLRTDATRRLRGVVQRIDLVSDAVTEERIVNVQFAEPPPRMAIGDLVEVTIRTAQIAEALSVPAAAVKQVDRRTGLWRPDGRGVAFRPATIGITTLEGRSQVLDGLAAGDEVVVYSERALAPGLKVKVVPAIVGGQP